MSKRRKSLLLIPVLLVVIIFQPLETNAIRPLATGWKVIKSDFNGGNFTVEILELGNIPGYATGIGGYEKRQDYLETAAGVRRTAHRLMDNMQSHNDESETGSVRMYLMGRSTKDHSNQKLPQGELMPIDSDRPMVALTFDDGPSEHTISILDTLSLYRSRGTFFVLGRLVEQYQDTIRLAHDRGNEILGHSWSHVNFNRLSREQIVTEITRTHDAITDVIGDSRKMYRPPYGSASNTVRLVSEELGFSIINWNLDPSDWRTTDVDEVYDSIMKEVEHRSIIVLHDTHASTAKAMERVIPALIERGYQLVTISEMFYYLGEAPQPGMMVDWSW